MAQTLEKKSTETKTFDMQFSRLLRSNDSIASITSATSTSCDFVTGSTNVTISDLVFDGSIVQFKIADGTDEEHYEIEVLVTTVNADVISGEGILRIKD